MLTLEHLVGKVNHLKIHTYPQCFTDTCEIIEELRVLPIKIDRYDVSLISDSFLNKRFLPFQVLHLALDLARAEPSGEGDDLMIGGISSFHQQSCLPALCPMFVDWDKDRTQIWNVQQQVIHQIIDLILEKITDKSREANTI